MAIFYVKKIGNDTTGNGSAATPWASVYKASQMVTTSGNTIYISGGTYTENNECSFSPGVSIQGEGKNVTIIQTTYSGSSYSQALFKFYSSNFTNGNQSVSGISFNGMNYVGKRAITVVKRSNVTVHDCDFLNFDHTPASFYGDSQNYYYQPTTWLTGNKFYNNTVTNCSAYSGSANQGVWWQGNDGFELYNCTIINNRGAGVGGDLVSSQTNKRTKIYDCTFERSSYVLPYWAFAAELRWEYGESEIYNCDIQGCIDICFNYKETYGYSWWIHDNKLGRHTPNGSQDIGIDIEAFSYDVIIERNTFNYLSAGITIARSYQAGTINDGLVIRNNLFTNIGCTGSTFSGQAIYGIGLGWDNDDATLTNTKIYNNTLKGYTNGRYGVLLGDQGTANGVEIKNNIIVDFTLAPVYAWKRAGYNTTISNLYIQYNDFYNNGNSNNFLTSNITPNPLTVSNIFKVNPPFVSSTDFRLQSGSTLIDSGVDVGLPYIGISPDIGAFEYYNGPNYYVSVDGNDEIGDGSLNNPVKTFNKVVTLATKSGDVINFGEGTFIFTTVDIPVGVSVLGKGDTTILQSNYVIGRVGGITGGSINLISPTEGTMGNQTLSNFKFVGTGLPNGSIGIVVKRRNNVIVHDLTIYDFEINGISFIGASTEVNIPTIYATGNKLYNCDIRKCGTADPTFTTWKNGGLVKWAGQDGMLIYDNYFSNKERDMGLNDNIVSVGYANKGCKYYNNESYKPDDDGEAWNIHIESWELEGGFEIYNNKFIGGGMAVDCAGHYSNLNGYEYTYSIHDNYFAPNVQFGSNIHNNNAICIEGLLQQHIYVYNNHFYKNKRPVIIQGTSWGPSNVNNIFISKNLMESCGINDSGYYDFMMYLGEIVSGSTFDNINFFNNTITADVTRNCALKIQTGDNVSIKNVNFKNNIVLNCTNQTFMYVVNNGSISGLTVTNNVLYGNSNNNLPKFSGNTVSDYIIGSNVNSDPLFINSGVGDFRLQSSSPARNTGSIVILPIMGQLPYNETAPDIGVLEYYKGSIYYVDLLGSDISGNGSLELPWQSLYKASNSVIDSDTKIHIKSGTYIESNKCSLSPGVSLEGDNSSNTIIKCRYITTRGHDFNDASLALVSAVPGTNGDQSISNITLDGDNLTGSIAIVVKCRNNVKIHNVNIVDFFINGITFQGQSNDVYVKPTLYATGNEIYNCYISNCTNGTSNWNGGGNIQWSGQDGFLIHDNILENTTRTVGFNGDNLQPCYYNKGWKVYNNKSYKPEDDGVVNSSTWQGANFHMEVASQTTPYTAGDELGGIEIYNNEFYGGNYILDFPSPGEKGVYDYYVSIHDNYFELNIINTTLYRSCIHLESLILSDVIVYNNHFKGWSQPIRIIDNGGIGGSPYSVSVINNITFHNNLIENPAMGTSTKYYDMISISPLKGGSTWSYINFFNNTILSSVNTSNYTTAIRIQNSGVIDNLVFKNNIFVNHKNVSWINITNSSVMSNIIIQYNDLYNNMSNDPNITGNAIINYIYSNNIFLNPLFVSNNDYNIQYNSPARNSGQNVGLPYSGSAPDMGAFEYGIYFDSVNGNDSWSGTTTYPYKSISKLNSILSTVNTGTTVYLKRGSEWSGSTITPTKSGSVSNPIVIDAYGTGEKPIISGFQTISNWTRSGSTNIWYKTISPQSIPNIVTVDGINTPKGRFPKSYTPNGGYLTFESYTGNTSIYDSSLSGNPSWVGSEIVIRVNTWSIGNGKVTNHVGGTLTFTGVIQTPTKNGLGYFFQNDLKCLSEFGDWCYVSGNSTFYMHFGSENPTNHIVKVGVVDELIYSYNRNYMTFNNLHLEGAIKYGIRVNAGGTGITISNCDFDLIGNNGIIVFGNTKNLLITNNNISNCNNQGMTVIATYPIIRYNNLTNIALFPGMGTENGGYSGIELNDINVSGATIEYNSITNVGNNGIQLRGSLNVVKNNFISYFGRSTDDCGGIYCSGESSKGDKIIGNIILYGVGNRDGLNPSGTTIGTASEGIYLDSVTDNKEVCDNTVAYCGNGGIRTHDSYNIMITGNTLYNNHYNLYLVKGTDNPAYQRNITLRNNISVATNNNQYALYIYVNPNEDPLLFGTSDYNYLMRPTNDTTTIRTDKNVLVSRITTNYTLETWQGTGNDLNSHKSPISVSYSDQIYFDYNATQTNKTVSLNGYKDLDGNVVTGYTLKPYTSIVLLETGIYFDSINGDDSGSGTTVSPYKSISKLNSVLSTVSTGSTIYLKRGSFWSGSTITPTKSGSPDGIITIDSYSEGEKPIISGFQTINGWIQSGSTNIYYKVINPQSPPNMVTINGVNTPKGRYPKFNTPNEGYLTLDAFTGDTVATALSDTYLATAPNWTGAEVVIRVNTWSTEIGLVTSHIGNKITFTGVGQKIDKVGLGYFFQNDLKCLTEFGDWYYNSGNSTFYMCFGADLPNEHIVKVSVVDDNIYCNYRTYSPYARYMKFNNLILEGANKYGFHINSGTGTTLSNCDIRNAGNAGIYGYCGANFMAIGNTILDSNKNGIGINGLNAVIRYNNITNTGLFAGMKGLKGNGIEIIDVNNTGSTIEYNSILNSGANGVHLRGNYNLFKNNYVSYFGLTIDDCGGIYMSGQFYIGDKVIGNIFTYGIGNRNGLNPSGTTTGTACEGIYMDSVTANKEIYDNTIAFCGSGGIRTHDSYNIMITGNTLYSNRYGFYPVKGINNPIYHRNITFNKNIVVSTTDSTWVQYPYRILTNINENPLLFGSSDYNYIMKPINGDDNMINVQVLGVSQNYYNLSEWQTFSNYDLHSNDSPFTTTSSSQILFEYNTGLTNRTIVLGSSYKNVDGTPSNNSITLAPYTSIILLRDNGIYSYLIMDLSGRLVFNDLNRILFA